MSLLRRLIPTRSEMTVSILLSVVALAVSASAHGFQGQYFGRWVPSERLQLYSFDENFPGANFRDRSEDGAGQWNELVSDMRFRREAGSVPFAPLNCERLRNANALFWGNIDGTPAIGDNTLAFTTVCPDSNGNNYAFSMKFDSSENWHTGTSSPGANEFDFWSVATHEFGHAAGSEHFQKSSSVCDLGPDRETMCQGTTSGTVSRRSLEEHDRHTYNAAYP